jgi:hypothetical protein
MAVLAVYQARTYLRHIVHTVRMKGKEDPSHVTRWLNRTADRLGWERLGRPWAERQEEAAPATPVAL